MTKILHLINGEHYAGAERVQDLLALRLPETGHEVGFICLKDGVFAKNRRSTCPLEIVLMRSRMDLSIVRRIVDHARAGGYEIVHTHTARSALIGQRVARQLGVPRVHHVHSPTQRDTESHFRNLINSALEDHLVLPGASHLIAVSSSLRSYLLDHGVPNSKISVVPNGVPVIRTVANWRAPVAGQQWIVGTVALFRPRKGIEVLLKALRLLIDQGFPVRLKAVGSFETPAYEASIRQLATELNLNSHIVWTGFCRDVHAELAEMQIFVLPSLFGEGLPMVVLEAMSMGVPVVASRVEGIPEVIGVDNAGIVVEPNDPGSLANGISALASGRVDATTMALAAHKRQHEHYSDTAMAKAVGQIYRRVLGQP